jgi:hypothetical protein
MRRAPTSRETPAMALPRLKGAFALAFLFAGEDDLLIGARRGSPLAVGYGDGEIYLGSDAIALAHARYGYCPMRLQGSGGRGTEANGADRTVDAATDRRTLAPRWGHSPSHRSHQDDFIRAVVRRGGGTGGQAA